MAQLDKSRIIRIRGRLHEVLEAGRTDDYVSIAFDTFLIALIVLNVAAFAMGTVDDVAALWGNELELFNLVSVIIFTLEYILRLWVCVDLPPLRHLPPWRARWRFARRPLLLVDLIAIMPFYLSFLFAFDLRILRVLRLLRFLKLARYSPALQTLGRVLATERNALFGAIMVMLSLLLFAATFIYFIEREAQPDVFGSVPQAAWWALATLTTVGYGDVVPITVLGKMFGGLVMVFGLGMFALPIGIIATGFAQEIHRREFVVTWSMVAKVPLFAELSAASISKIMTNLRAQSYSTAALIIREDEPLNAIYFIASGEVEIDFARHSQLIDAGGFFGETSLSDDTSSMIKTARALSNCDLMILDRHDFEHIMRENKDFAAQIHRVQRTQGSKRVQRTQGRKRVQRAQRGKKRPKR